MHFNGCAKSVAIIEHRIALLLCCVKNHRILFRDLNPKYGRELNYCFYTLTQKHFK